MCSELSNWETREKITPANVLRAKNRFAAKNYVDRMREGISIPIVRRVASKRKFALITK